MRIKAEKKRMKLKTRIIIAFFMMIIMPIVLVSVAAYGFGSYHVDTLRKSYGVESFPTDSLTNYLKAFEHVLSQEISDIEALAGAEPAKFENIQFLEELNTQLSETGACIHVYKDDVTYYSGVDQELASQLENVLGTDRMPDLEGGMFFNGQAEVLIRQVSFSYQDDAKGDIFVIMRLNRFQKQVKSFLFDMLFIMVLILIFCSSLFSVWIYRGISVPLKKLRIATNNIKEGNLDFTLDVEAGSEIDELCGDFEDMRKRLKESAEEKVQYDTDNKELISNISHDLKTPITAIKGYAEGIIDGVADTPEKMDKYIRTIYNKSNDMERLINELMFYSKIDTNRIPYTFNKINVAEYFNDCVEELLVELESKNFKLQYFNYVDEDVQVIADAEQLKRVVNNIVSNALKYNDKPQGIMNMRIKDVGDFIQVEMEDNGQGIPVKSLPYIFDRFYRSDASRNSTKGGSGIGLSIVKKIIEDHGGQIWANSKEGTGTTMYFVLRKYQEVPVNE